MVVCVDAAHVDELIELFKRHNESAWLLGQIETAEPGAEQVRMVSA
jgi:phosphoribosylaminoimidazole (AIR) synthetase